MKTITIELPAGLTQENLMIKASEYQKIKEDVDWEWLVQQGIEFMANLDPDIFYRMKYFAEGLEIPIWLVIQNILISDWAKQAARIEVEGPDPCRGFPEFVTDILDDGAEKPRTGEKLFNSLIQIYKQEHISKKIRRERQSFVDTEPRGVKGMPPPVWEE